MENRPESTVKGVLSGQERVAVLSPTGPIQHRVQNLASGPAGTAWRLQAGRKGRFIGSNLQWSSEPGFFSLV